MDSPRYSITYCSGTGMGLLAISSCAIGLLIAMVLVSKDSALVTSPSDYGYRCGSFFHKSGFSA